MEAGIGLIFFLVVLLFQAVIWGLVIANIVYFILAIIDVTKREWPDKVTWLLIVILVPFGPFIYWFSEKKKLDARGILPIHNASIQPPQAEQAPTSHTKTHKK